MFFSFVSYASCVFLQLLSYKCILYKHFYPPAIFYRVKYTTTRLESAHVVSARNDIAGL